MCTYTLIIISSSIIMIACFDIIIHVQALRMAKEELARSQSTGNRPVGALLSLLWL